MKRARAARIGCICLAVVAAYAAGHYSRPRSAPDPGESYVPPNEIPTPLFDIAGDPLPKLQDIEAPFVHLVSAWNARLRHNEGYLPPDPYAFLHEELSGCSLDPYEFAKNLPPRLNPDLSQNPKWPVFWMYVDHGLNEAWTCYADGTWRRLPSAAAGADWSKPMEDAGYPIGQWKRWRDWAAWAERNKSRLVWDPSRKLYIVGQSARAVATQP